MEPTPLRPAEQVVGGFLRLSLGGKTFEVRDLPLRLSRKWVDEFFRPALAEVVADVQKVDEIDDLVRLLADNPDTEARLLIAWDTIWSEAKSVPRVLPDFEWWEDNATGTEVYEGVKVVARAAFPKGPDLLRLVPGLLPAIMEAISRGAAAATVAINSLRLTSSSPPSTAGQPTTSKTTSPTRSSSGTSRKPPTAKRSKRSQSSTAS